MLRQEELTEEGIRIAASLASCIMRAKMELTVTGNGMKPIHLKEGAGQIRALYQELARIDTDKPAARICENLRAEREKAGTGMIYVIISANQDIDTAKAVAAMAEGGAEILWVVPVRASDGIVTCNIRNVNVLKWEVQI